MKARIAIFIFLICIIIFFAYRYIRTSSVTTSVAPLPVQIPTSKQERPTLTYQDIVYDYESFTVSRLSQLHLIPNFDTPIRGSELATKNQCMYASSGGFYSTDNKPLGAFITEDYRQSKARTSALFNGFFGFTDTNAAITKSLDDTYTSILQSGPLLLFDATPLPLAIQNDEYARRSVVLITADNHVLFVTFYIHDSIYNGPLLGDLPMIVKQFADNQQISVDTALNLDGGSASYFKNSDSELPELTPIGSMFCLQK